MSSDIKLDELAINTVRVLAADVVQKANSGHPGMPMGMAPAAHTLFSRFLHYNPANPKWINRDRWVLSNGHGCALQYIMLHLSGYPLTIEDLKQFRQLDSKTPGHPESFLTAGVEVTTGPLGQGFANAVGLAIAQEHLAATYNKEGFPLLTNFTYVFCGDGCLQEGVCAEAASLAGHLGLGKLIVFYDDNKITIDGETHLSFSEDVPKRFQSYGWHTVTVTDGDTSDVAALQKAVDEARAVTDKPSIISLKTTIGYGAKKQGTEEVHGQALGAEAVKDVKVKFGFDPAQSFVVPQAVHDLYATYKKRGEELEAKWHALFDNYAKQHPALAEQFTQRITGVLPANWKSKLPTYKPTDKADATRNTSNTVLNAVADAVPDLMGGSADLTGSNKTAVKKWHDFQKKTPDGKYLRFGVREHAMAAIGNGLQAYGGIIPFTATFLNFIEYCFPSVRLAALSHHQQILIMTHDSIGLGEDGPTHQPIEAVALCRATPNVAVWRPADGNETVAAYISAVESRKTPSVLALSRQNLPQLNNTPEKALHGAYTVFETSEGKHPELIFIATGSEVHVSIEAAKLFAPLNVRVVSAPSTTIFEQQSVEYRRSVLPIGVPVIAVEALTYYGWGRLSHYAIAMSTFGASAPDKALFDRFGLTAPKIAATAKEFLDKFKAELSGAPFPFLPIQSSIPLHAPKGGHSH